MKMMASYWPFPLSLSDGGEDSHITQVRTHTHRGEDSPTTEERTRTPQRTGLTLTQERTHTAEDRTHTTVERTHTPHMRGLAHTEEDSHIDRRHRGRWLWPMQVKGKVWHFQTGVRIRAMSRGQGSPRRGPHKQSGLTTPSQFRPHWAVKKNVVWRLV